jgi:hypothetical protein
MVNGYSGFSPPPWQEFITFMTKSFPQQKSIDKLQEMGVNYIIIDKTMFNKEYTFNHGKYKGDTIVTALKKNHSVSFIKTIDNYIIFEICCEQTSYQKNK